MLGFRFCFHVQIAFASPLFEKDTCVVFCAIWLAFDLGWAKELSGFLVSLVNRAHKNLHKMWTTTTSFSWAAEVLRYLGFRFSRLLTWCSQGIARYAKIVRCIFSLAACPMVYGGFILLGQRPFLLAHNSYCVSTRGFLALVAIFLSTAVFSLWLQGFVTLQSLPDWRAHSQVLTSNQLDQEMHPHIRLVEFPIWPSQKVRLQIGIPIR